MNETPIKFAARINRSVLADLTPPDQSFNYIDIGSVGSDGTIERPSETTRFADAPSRARRLASPGSTIVSTVRTYLRAIAYVDQDLASSAVFSTGFAVLEPRPQFDPRFFHYACRAETFVEEVVARSVGVSYPAIAPTELGDLRIPTPPIESQRLIADFLDDQVARIDETIRLREEQVLALADIRTSALAEAMSGERLGLAMRRDERLGSLVAEWPTVQLKRVVPRIGVGLVVNPSDYFADSGVPFLHGSNVRDGWLDLNGVRRMSESDSVRLRSSMLHAGDVVVVRAGYPGRAAVIPSELEGSNCASILVLRKSSKVVPHYLAAFFNAPQGKAQVRVAKYGAAQEQINVGDVINFVMPLPPLDVQTSMLRHLDSRLKVVDRARVQMETQNAALVERKRSLITAAVTGYFDVSTASGRDVVAE